MATFVVCSSCSKTLEIAAIDQLPTKWERVGSAIVCPRCVGANEDGAITDVLDEKMINPDDDTLDENFDECDVCRGPCQGH